ncbi:metallophosphoesterase [Candidatus Hydrogenedentota bacterium]
MSIRLILIFAVFLLPALAGDAAAYVDPNSLVVTLMGDPQYPMIPETEANIQTAMDDLANMDHDFLAVLGDLVQNQASYYDDYNRLIPDQSTTSVYSLAGNGDLGAGLSAYTSETGFPLYYAIYKRGIRFIFTSVISTSGNSGHICHLGLDQLTWLTQELAADTISTTVILAHPPVFETTWRSEDRSAEPAPGSMYLYESAEMRRLFAQYPNIKVYAHGHLHHQYGVTDVFGRNEYFVEGNVLHISVGGTSHSRGSSVLYFEEDRIIAKVRDHETESWKDIYEYVHTQPTTLAPEPVLSFGVLADAQYADADPNGNRYYRESPGKLQECVNDFNSKGVDFVVQLGDLVDIAYADYDVMAPIYEQLTMPGYSTLGNHDQGFPERTLVPGRLGMLARYHDFDLSGWRFIVLDSVDISYYYPGGSPERTQAEQMVADLTAEGAPNARTWNGALSDQQLTWLDGKLSDASQAGEKVILFTHMPAYPFDEGANLWNDTEVVNVIEQHDCVVAYMNGHEHSGNYAEKNGVHYLNLKAMVDQQYETAYATVEVYSDHLEIIGKEREPNRYLSFTPAVEIFYPAGVGGSAAISVAFLIGLAAVYRICRAGRQSPYCSKRTSCSDIE